MDVGASGGRGHLDRDACAVLAFGRGEVVVDLQDQPEAAAIAELAPKPQRRFRRDRALAVDDTDDASRRYAQRAR